MPFTTMLQKAWLRRLLWISLSLLLLCVLAGLALPGLLKSQMQSRGSAALGRTVTVGAVEFKPWTLELTVSDLKLATADGKATQLAITKVYADANIESLWRLAPVIDAITIDQPQLTLTHLGGGHYDIDDLLKRFAPAPDAAPSAAARFALYNLVVNEGSADFVDHVAGGQRKHSLRKFNVSLPFLSSLESQRDVVVQPHLAFELNGSAFDSAAQGMPFATVRKGEATLSITHLDIKPYLPYLPATLPVRVQAAVLDSSLKLSFEQAATDKLLVSGHIQVSGLRVGDRTGGEFLSVGSLQTVIKELRPLEQSLVLESLEVNAPVVVLARNHDGVLSLPGGAAPDANTAAKPAHSVWQIALERFKLQAGQVRFTDDSVAPAVKLALAETQVSLRDVHWPLTQPVLFDATAQLLARDAKSAQAARIQLSGKGTDDAGTVTAKLSDLGLSLAAPYLANYLLPQAKGMLEGEWVATWKGSDVQVQAKRLALRDFALAPPAGKTDITAKELPSFKLLEASDLALDLPKHAVTLGRLTLQNPNLRLARGDDGQWMFAHWFPHAAPAASVAGKPTAKALHWTLSLADTRLVDGTLAFVDRLPAKTVFLELGSLQARMRNLTLDGNKPMPLTLSAQVRSVRTDPGPLRFDGTLMWAPLVLDGRLETAQFPAQALAHYATGALRLDLLRADTSFKGQLHYASLPAGPEVQLSGDAALEELRLNSVNRSTQKPAQADTDSEELLSWKALSAPGFEFSMAPGAPLRLKVREVSLADFFARLIVNTEGRLVLQDLVSAPEKGSPTAAQGVAVQASAPAEAVPVHTASATDPVIDIGPIRLLNGRVAFSDRFIKPNYSAALSELSGSLSHFSSQANAPAAKLELRGRAEGTASLDINGTLKPLAQPLELAINGRVRDLELSPLSSYAIKYAGYGIERGKLSVDVNYSVAPNGQLQASNKIVLNQLVFGDEAPGANHLPVKLAVSLLADRNGVIDLDIPLSGSLNDPEFRVWPIVWKIVGNIVAKALTSPFKLIGGLLSGSNSADELSTVAFAPGTARISPAALAGLDQVAKALLDKPDLRLTVVGTASLAREADAIRRERLNSQLLAEKRRVAASAAQDVTAVTAVTAQETPALLKEVYRRSSLKKPRNVLGLSKDLPAAEMETLLLQNSAVDEDTVRELALNRSLAVREYLTARQLPSDRLFLGAADTTPDDANWQPRAELSLEHH